MGKGREKLARKKKKKEGKQILIFIHPSSFFSSLVTSELMNYWYHALQCKKYRSFNCFWTYLMKNGWKKEWIRKQENEYVEGMRKNRKKNWKGFVWKRREGREPLPRYKLQSFNGTSTHLHIGCEHQYVCNKVSVLSKNEKSIEKNGGNFLQERMDRTQEREKRTRKKYRSVQFFLLLLFPSTE